MTLDELIKAYTEARELMEWFCGRVDNGEARSTKTYNAYKEHLAKYPPLSDDILADNDED